MKSPILSCTIVLILSLGALRAVHAASATWNLNPTSGDWNTAANWTPATVPNGPDAKAIFDISNITEVSLSAEVIVREIIFNPGASTFTITAPNQIAEGLRIVGAGLNNQSGTQQGLVAPEYGTYLGLPTVTFSGNALAGDLITLTANPRGGIRFQDNSGADHATIVGAEQSAIVFADTSDAGSAIITASGADQAGSYGSDVDFIGNSDAANAILIAEDGIGDQGGGRIYFTDDSSGGTAEVQVFGKGTLLVDHGDPGVTIGSLEGDGKVALGAGTLSIGSNGRDTVFSGVIQDFYIFSHTLIKTGEGALHLRGASTYTGGTTIESGELLADNTAGSALGTEPVQVNSGTLGGKGIIAGQVTVGTGSGPGASLGPSIEMSKPTTLTIQSTLTFKVDGIYIYKLNTKRARADQVIANGVTIESGAQFNFVAVANKRLTLGAVFTAITNTSASGITGTFANLPDGSTFTAGRNNYQVSYEGGDGNDLTLTVVP